MKALMFSKDLFSCMSVNITFDEECLRITKKDELLKAIYFDELTEIGTMSYGLLIPIKHVRLVYSGKALYFAMVNPGEFIKTILAKAKQIKRVNKQARSLLRTYIVIVFAYVVVAPFAIDTSNLYWPIKDPFAMTGIVAFFLLPNIIASMLTVIKRNSLPRRVKLTAALLIWIFPIIGSLNMFLYIERYFVSGAHKP